MVEYIVKNGIITGVKSPVSINEAMQAINNIGKKIEDISK